MKAMNFKRRKLWAFRTKSFTDRDITLQFHIMDILKVNDGLSIAGMME